MVLLNYPDRQTVDSTLQVRVAQIDRIKAQLPQQIALVERRKLKLDRFTHTVAHDLQALRRASENLSAWIADNPIEFIAIESKMQLQLFRSRAVELELAIDELLQYSRSVEWRLAPSA